MESNHGFDFALSTQNMDFYQKVKLINFVRKQIHDNKCLFCDNKFENFFNLEKHLIEKDHYKMPELKSFDQPE